MFGQRQVEGLEILLSRAAMALIDTPAQPTVGQLRSRGHSPSRTARVRNLSCCCKPLRNTSPLLQRHLMNGNFSTRPADVGAARRNKSGAGEYHRSRSASRTRASTSSTTIRMCSICEQLAQACRCRIQPFEARALVGHARSGHQACGSMRQYLGIRQVTTGHHRRRRSECHRRGKVRTPSRLAVTSRAQQNAAVIATGSSLVGDSDDALH